MAGSRASWAVSGVRRAAFCGVVGVAVAALVMFTTRPCWGDEKWFGVMVPAGVNLGAPRLAFDWGLHTDLLFVHALDPGRPPYRGETRRIVLGPFVDARAIGVSNVGLGGGLEVGAFSRGGILSDCYSTVA